MDWSSRRKLGCFTIMVILAAAIVGFFVYKIFFTRPATCFDGIQNQNEHGIDCGGVCALVCPFEAKTVVPLWARAFPIQGGIYSLVAYVENQNPTAGIEKISYEFRVYDQDNILAGDPVDGVTFIGPNDRTAIFATPFSAGNRVPKNVFFKFTADPSWITTDKRYQIPQLSSANVSLINAGTSPKLSADVVNNTLYDYKKIEVVAILYDADGNAVNASDTYIDVLPQQSKKTVYYTWPKGFDRAVTRIEIIPRLNPFIQGNE